VNIYLFKKMNRELINTKYRAIGSSVLIIISVAFYIGLAGMVPNTERALEDKVDELELNDYLVHVNSANESEETELGTISGVEKVESRLQISSRIKFSTGGGGGTEESGASLYGIDPTTMPEINQLELVGGKSRFFAGNGSGTALIERNFAETEGLEVGDIITVVTGSGEVELTIIAIVLSPEYFLLPINPNSLLPYPGDMAVLFVPSPWLRDSYGLNTTEVNEFTFLFDGTLDEDQVIDEIDGALEDRIILYSTPRDEVYGYKLVKDDLEQGKTFSALFAFIILLVAFFIVYVSFTRIVQEQRKEIGILRALGYSQRSVLLSYLYMAFLIGLGGSLVGILLGLPVSNFFSTWYVSLLLGTEPATITIDMQSVMIGLMFGPATALLASGIAVWDTVSMEPHDAIRGTPRSERRILKAYRKGKLMIANHTHSAHSPKSSAPGAESTPSSRLRNLPYILRYTIRTMKRNSFRTTFTAIALAFSILVGALPILMWGSFTNSINESIDEYEKWDLLVEYSLPLDQESADGLNDGRIVDKAYIARIQGEIEHDGSSVTTVIGGLNSTQTLHRFNVKEGSIPTSLDQAILSESFANDHNIGVGDSLRIRASNGSVEVTVSGLVQDVLGEVIIDLEMLEAISGEPLFLGMYAKVASNGGDAEAVKDSMNDSPMISQISTKEGTKSGLLEFMSSFSSMIYMFSFIGVIIAAATLANTVFIGVLERFPQYGQLRAIGYSRREIAKSIFTEIFILVSLGGILGAPLTYAFLVGYEKSYQEFFPTYETTLALSDWLGYLFVVMLTIGLAILAAIPSLRLINRMDIAQTVSGARFG
jgi:putative ABC transport system permease protein